MNTNFCSFHEPLLHEGANRTNARELAVLLVIAWEMRWCNTMYIHVGLSPIHVLDTPLVHGVCWLYWIGFQIPPLTIFAVNLRVKWESLRFSGLEYIKNVQRINYGNMSSYMWEYYGKASHGLGPNENKFDLIDSIFLKIDN